MGARIPAERILVPSAPVVKAIESTFEKSPAASKRFPEHDGRTLTRRGAHLFNALGRLPNTLGLGLDAREIDAVQEMDAPENADVLLKIGRKIGERVVDAHFPATFDLPKAG